MEGHRGFPGGLVRVLDREYGTGDARAGEVGAECDIWEGIQDTGHTQHT